MKRLEKILPIALVCVLLANLACAGPTKDAWTKLVGKKCAKRSAFAFVENDPALPNVLLYGDSISIAYTQRVREKLKGKANVFRLYCNGGDSGSFIKKMTTMHTVMQDAELDGPWIFQWDIIHFNVGLHDLKHVLNGKLDKKNGKQVSSIDTYKKNLHAIVVYLKKRFPDAKLIFATTTPVPEGDSGRIAGDAERYNVAAIAALRKYPGITINDLHTFTTPHHSKWWRNPRNVHYNKTGSNAQGDEVARVILEALLKKDESNTELKATVDTAP